MLIISLLKDIYPVIALLPEAHAYSYYPALELYRENPVKPDVLFFFIPEGEAKEINKIIKKFYNLLLQINPPNYFLIRPHRDQRIRNNEFLLQENQVHLSTCSFGIPFKQNYLIYTNKKDIPNKRCSGECRFKNNELHYVKNWNNKKLNYRQKQLVEIQKRTAEEPILGTILYFLLSYVPTNEKILL